MTNYIFVDFENTQVLPPLNSEVRLFIFAGQHLKKKLTQVAAAVQPLKDVNFITLQQSGHNSADFCLAYHLGETIAKDSSGNFIVVTGAAGVKVVVASAEFTRRQA